MKSGRVWESCARTSLGAISYAPKACGQKLEDIRLDLKKWILLIRRHHLSSCLGSAPLIQALYGDSMFLLSLMSSIVKRVRKVTDEVARLDVTMGRLTLSFWWRRNMPKTSRSQQNQTDPAVGSPHPSHTA